MFASTPPPPYWAVIFTSHKHADEGYAPTTARMEELARAQPGFLGVESARGEDGVGITVSYWRDEESFRNWKANAEHRIAQETGRERWYSQYVTRIAKVERDYSFSAAP
ncbi:MAG TPA: antibiotic biosynthesis monooxygenase [Thermoanaerobaculia bacterium]|jgi:heme-degrading monooxygenase HmoA|nr:antibiotic biosynthesis monooxygenase [Thermoanaerobaculia bacterium]